MGGCGRCRCGDCGCHGSLLGTQHVFFTNTDRHLYRARNYSFLTDKSLLSTEASFLLQEYLHLGVVSRKKRGEVSDGGFGGFGLVRVYSTSQRHELNLVIATKFSFFFLRKGRGDFRANGRLHHQLRLQERFPLEAHSSLLLLPIRHPPPIDASCSRCCCPGSYLLQVEKPVVVNFCSPFVALSLSIFACGGVYSFSSFLSEKRRKRQTNTLTKSFKVSE